MKMDLLTNATVVEDAIRSKEKSYLRDKDTAAIQVNRETA